MRPETPLPIRLEDYRVPDYLVETVDLDFSLEPRATRVRARTAFAPNPKGVQGAPLLLDGDELTLVSIALDGRRLEAHEYRLSETALTLVAPPARRFVLDIETKLDPTANTKLIRPLPLGRRLLHPMRGAKVFGASPIFWIGPTSSRSIRRGSRPSTMKLRSCSRTAI